MATTTLFAILLLSASEAPVIHPLGTEAKPWREAKVAPRAPALPLVRHGTKASIGPGGKLELHCEPIPPALRGMRPHAR